MPSPTPENDGRRPRKNSRPVAERNALARVVDSPAFTAIVVATIAVNAVVLGLQTYQGLVDRWGDRLDLINGICLAIFIVELLIRMASYWPRPLAFFRSGWNVFDFVVILAVFVPGIRQNSTLLRLLRLLRVVRIVRVLPDLRVLLLGVWRSVPPLASIGAVTAMILFVYGMVGWIWFGDELPEQWGNIGRAMLALFVMLTLEDFPVYMADAMEIEPWAWIYFVSFILVAAFIVLNVLIGVVLNSMEEARELDRRAALRARYGVTRPSPIDPEAHAPVAERIAILRSALDELELELAIGPTGDERPAR
jgi:voltage-gated sodium channel